LTRELGSINAIVEDALHHYSVADPSAIAPSLALGLKTTNELVDEVNACQLSDDAKYNVLHELKVKQAEFNDALVLSLGISMNASVTQEHPPSGPFARFMGDRPTFQMAIPGQHFPVLVHLAEASAVPLKIDKVSLEMEGASGSSIQASGPASGQLDGGAILNTRFEVQVPENAAYTKPYFDRPGLEQPYYDVLVPADRGKPLAPYPLTARVSASYEGVSIELSEVVQTIAREVGPGVVFHPMPIGPAISVTMLQSAGIVPLGQQSFPVSVRIHSNVKGPAEGSLHLDLPPGWKSNPATAPFSFAQDGQEQIATLQVSPVQLTEQTYHLTAVANYNNHDYKEGYIPVGYPSLRPYFLYSAAAYQTTGTDVKVAPNLQVGYIEGSGDDVPTSLENLGIHVHFLTQGELAGGDLSKYNVILVGVRAYAVRNDLVTYNGRLLDYVKKGGAVVVQYQTPEFDHNFGPYPYSMTSDPEEVTDEASTVTFVEPSNPALVWPNKITAKDFSGWIEERGSKFMATWDPRYQAPLETHDPEQDPQKGGFLFARYGSGVWVYDAYAFYRELPLGVPGAYRIFANLISLPSNPGLRAMKR
jgi:hypothetical protein